MNCKKCGQELEANTEKCPACGEEVIASAKVKKPVTKKWWFWVLVVTASLMVLSSVFCCGIGAGGTTEATTADDQTVAATEQTEETEEEKTAKEEITTKEEATAEELTSSTGATDETDYRDTCISVGYKDIARIPDDYKGMDVYFSGQVIQVLESSFSDNVTYRINVTQDVYGYWEDTVYVTYDLPDGSPRILEDDIVIFYGVCKGTYTYSAVLGNSITIPYVDAKYIDIIG